ncbi:MAG: ubiquinone biosynthesis protein UbiB, partial [Rhizobiales bacterium]|nr:ubiquinone biosynthesis protein UbiB [Hyphomicrobiales bacterium]
MGFLFHIFRLLRAGHIIAKYRIIPADALKNMPFGAKLGLFMLAPFASRKDTALDRRIGLALVKLGPTYIKLGQFLATRPDLVGEALAANLKQLQDDVPAFGHDIAVKQLEAALDIKLDDVFSDFSQPIAAASIAQVHKATLKDGRKVAVKILRPDVGKRFA